MPRIIFDGASNFRITGGNLGEVDGDVVTINIREHRSQALASASHPVPLLVRNARSPSLPLDLDTSDNGEDGSNDSEVSDLQDSGSPSSTYGHQQTPLLPPPPPPTVASQDPTDSLSPLSGFNGLNRFTPAHNGSRVLPTLHEAQYSRSSEVLPERAQSRASTLPFYSSQTRYAPQDSEVPVTSPSRTTNLLLSSPRAGNLQRPPTSAHAIQSPYGISVTSSRPGSTFTAARATQHAPPDRIHSRPLPPIPGPPPLPVHAGVSPSVIQGQSPYWTPRGWTRNVRLGGYVSSPTIEVGGVPSPTSTISFQTAMHPRVGFGYWHQPPHLYPYDHYPLSPSPLSTPTYFQDGHAYASTAQLHGDTPQLGPMEWHQFQYQRDYGHGDAAPYPGYYPRSSGPSYPGRMFRRF